MENASKALLIAGGVLLTMMIVALLMFSWGKIKDFYNGNDDLINARNLSEFNLQFTNYDNRDVHGYELISLANKVADYNFRYSNYKNTANSEDDAKNDEQYNPITMKINLQGKANVFSFGDVVDGIRKIDSNSNQNSFFNNYNNMIQSSTRNDILRIITEATGIQNFYGNGKGNADQITTRLAKSIDALILSEEQLEYNKNNKNMTYDESKLAAVNDFKFITKMDKINNQDIDYTKMVQYLTNSNSSILKYYEYYQFKRGIFKCSNISYDDVTGRVSEIDFNFTGNME